MLQCDLLHTCICTYPLSKFVRHVMFQVHVLFRHSAISSLHAYSMLWKLYSNIIFYKHIVSQINLDPQPSFVASVKRKTSPILLISIYCQKCSCGSRSCDYSYCGIQKRNQCPLHVHMRRLNQSKYGICIICMIPDEQTGYELLESNLISSTFF